ncbi:HEPN domain-containing protein [Candidatus Woesearchaeota archaeon]|nr:HEPN domain-containing protein [Candidatus Woesearchaeota archaeon]
MKEECKNWLDQAKADFDSAKYNLDGAKYYVAAFLAQQTAEKALKALFIDRFGELVKVHDLVFLAKKLSLPVDLTESCDRLSRVYVETRYPTGSVIPSKKFSKKTVDEFMKIAQEVLLWVEKLLRKS